MSGHADKMLESGVGHKDKECRIRETRKKVLLLSWAREQKKKKKKKKTMGEIHEQDKAEDELHDESDKINKEQFLQNV